LKPLEEQGYIIVAQNNRGGVDYVDCATTLAKTILYYHPDASICLLTNVPNAGNPHLFRYVHLFDEPVHEHAWANDWQVWNKTPFRETIKLEADMMITSPINHWWNMLRHRDIVVSTGCRDWQDQQAKSRYYRQVFDANNLPDVYNAITYWRRSETAQEFFKTVRNIFENWDEYKKLLKFPEETPSTDVVYAMAANIVGPELCTMPFASYPTIVHMKKHIAGTQDEDWRRELIWEYKDYIMRVNTMAQHGAFHYHARSARYN